MRILKEEVEFWSKLASWLENNLPEEKIKELKTLFKEDGGIRSFVEKELKRLILDIKRKRVSLDGFTCKDAEQLQHLIDCSAIDENLLDKLSSLIYGADERERYFKR